MATRTGYRHPLKRLAHGINLTIDHGDLFALDIDRGLIEFHQPIKTHTDQCFIKPKLRIETRCDQIPRDMFLDQAIEWYIPFKSANHIITVSISEGQICIVFRSMRFRIPNNIEPMPSPMLSILSGIEHPIDKFPPSRFMRESICQSRYIFPNFLNGRRQTTQSETQSANQ